MGPSMTELDEIVFRSLKAFTDEVFLEPPPGHKRWEGMERGAVSLFAFGPLLKECRKGSVLYDPAQIGMEVRVSRPPKEGVKGAKATRICKDLVIWPRPKLTWRDESGPLAILEWKTNREVVSAENVAWLRDFSKNLDGFTGYAVCLDLDQRNFRLSVTRVSRGSDQPNWKVIK